MYIHWRARDNRSKWETEGERGGGATKTRTVFPSWLISTRFRIRTRRRLDRSCHLDSRLDGKPVVISIFHFARATRASRPPFPSQRLITTKRRFPFPPTQNFASSWSSLIPRQFFYLIGRLAARQVAKLLKAVINDSTKLSSFASDKNLLRPETGNRASGSDSCKSLQDRSEVCGYIGDNVVQRGVVASRGEERDRVEKEIYGNR